MPAEGAPAPLIARTPSGGWRVVGTSATSTSEAAETARVQTTLTRLLAVAALVATGVRYELFQGVTVAHAAGLALLPFWWPALRRYWAPRTLVVIGLGALLSGLWLAWMSSMDHALSVGVLTQSVALLLAVLLGIGVVAWARTLMPDWQVGVWFGIGIALAISPGGLFPTNPWKFGFALPTTLILLSLAARTGRRWVEVVAMLGLSGVSALNDARSGFAVLVLAAVIIGTQWGKPRPDGRRTWFARVAIFVALALAVYNLGLALLLGGRLGEETQRRSERQVAESGSIILGGRPELAATLALMAERPWGLGPGVAANLDEIMVAKTGMAAIGYEPNNGYVERFMFGPRTALHSIIGDLWVLFGIPGLVVALALLYVIVRNLATAVATRTASGLLAYVSCLTLWNMFFGPLSTSAAVLILAVGLGLQRRPETQGGDVRRDEPAWVAALRARESART